MRQNSICFLAGLAGGSLAFASPSQPNAQQSLLRTRTTGPVSTEQTADEKDKAEQVKAVFETAWNGWYEFAFPDDELLPVTNGSINQFQGWAMTMVRLFPTILVLWWRSTPNRTVYALSCHCSIYCGNGSRLTMNLLGGCPDNGLRHGVYGHHCEELRLHTNH